jgi:hypothetical protein
MNASMVTTFNVFTREMITHCDGVCQIDRRHDGCSHGRTGPSPQQLSAGVPWGEGVHRVLLCEAIGRPLVRACHRGIREFCLSRGTRVFMRQARRRSCSPCCRPALREPGCRTLLQIARAVVGLDRTGMPSCPGAANETSPPRPSFPEGSILPPPLGQIGVPFRRNKAATCPSRKSYPHIAMVQSGENWRGDDRSAPLDSSP